MRMISREHVLPLILVLVVVSSYFALVSDLGWSKETGDEFRNDFSVPDFRLELNYSKEDEVLGIKFVESSFTENNTDSLFIMANSSVYMGDMVLESEGEIYNTSYLIGPERPLKLPIEEGSTFKIVEDGHDIANDGDKSVEPIPTTDNFMDYFLIWNNGSGRYNRAIALITYENGSWTSKRRGEEWSIDSGRRR